MFFNCLALPMTSHALLQLGHLHDLGWVTGSSSLTLSLESPQISGRTGAREDGSEAATFHDLTLDDDRRLVKLEVHA